MGARDKFWELEGSTWYILGTGREHLIQPGNWRGAHDVVWELEGFTWSSQGTAGGGGARDAGNSLVQNIENL